MRFGSIKDGTCINIIEFKTEAEVQEIESIFVPSQCDILTRCPNFIWHGRSIR